MPICTQHINQQCSQSQLNVQAREGKRPTARQAKATCVRRTALETTGWKPDGKASLGAVKTMQYITFIFVDDNDIFVDLLQRSWGHTMRFVTKNVCLCIGMLHFSSFHPHFPSYFLFFRFVSSVLIFPVSFLIPIRSLFLRFFSLLRVRFTRTQSLPAHTH